MPLHAIDRTGEPRRRGEGGRRGRVPRAVSRSVSTPRSATPTIAVGTATPGRRRAPSSSTRAGVTPRSRSSATIARAPPAVSSLWPKER
jgi:hypothetical protein